MKIIIEGSAKEISEFANLINRIQHTDDKRSFRNFKSGMCDRIKDFCGNSGNLCKPKPLAKDLGAADFFVEYLTPTTDYEKMTDLNKSKETSVPFHTRDLPGSRIRKNNRNGGNFNENS